MRQIRSSFILFPCIDLYSTVSRWISFSLIPNRFTKGCPHSHVNEITRLSVLILSYYFYQYTVVDSGTYGKVTKHFFFHNFKHCPFALLQKSWVCSTTMLLGFPDMDRAGSITHHFSDLCGTALVPILYRRDMFLRFEVSLCYTNWIVKLHLKASQMMTWPKSRPGRGKMSWGKRLWGKSWFGATESVSEAVDGGYYLNLDSFIGTEVSRVGFWGSTVLFLYQSEKETFGRGKRGLARRGSPFSSPCNLCCFC